MTTGASETVESQPTLATRPDPIRPHFDATITPDMPYVFGSTLCRAEHFMMPLFAYWCRELKMHPAMHRKLWELVYIVHTLHELGLMKPGGRGLGFGVGHEPLSTYFAHRGVSVTATDLDLESAVSTGWADSGQHALAAANLFWPGIMEREAFDKLVTFQNVDMNRIPETLRNFDFCWSACALEHAGSIDHGLVFIENSLNTLRPGGVAIHTTEFNLSSDVDTVEEGPTVLFRKQDIKLLVRLLRARGHKLLPLNLYSGGTEVDEFIDVPPYGTDPHLKLQIGAFNSTSIGLAIVKG